MLAVGKHEVFSPWRQRPSHLRVERQGRGAPGAAAGAHIPGWKHPTLLGVGAHVGLGVADAGANHQGGADEEHLEDQHRRIAAGGELREGRLDPPAAGIAGGGVGVRRRDDAQLVLARLGVGRCDPVLQIAVHLGGDGGPGGVGADGADVNQGAAHGLVLMAPAPPRSQSRRWRPGRCRCCAPAPAVADGARRWSPRWRSRCPPVEP